MNFHLTQIPERTVIPRQHGLTMVMDKGLSIREAEDMISISGPYIDVVKLGFGSSFLTPNLEGKLKMYKDLKVPVYFGGTLLEAYLIRGMYKEFRLMLDKFGVEMAEVSDGSITLPHEKKLRIIRELSTQVKVLSEVGSKEEGIIIRPNVWIDMMQKELDAGSWKVIAEARESGTVGIFRPNGKTHVVLINKIISKVAPENIIWEAPQKSQQAWFVKLFGANVNLGNIAPHEVIALESLRVGLRSDTFFQFMDQTKDELNATLEASE